MKRGAKLEEGKREREGRGREEQEEGLCTRVPVASLVLPEQALPCFRAHRRRTLTLEQVEKCYHIGERGLLP